MIDLADNPRLGNPTADFILAIPGERDGQPLLTLERHLFGHLKRVEMLGMAALNAWDLLAAAFDGDGK